MPKPDDKRLKSILIEWESLLDSKSRLHGVESDLVRSFIENERVGFHEGRIPTSELDTIVTEMAFRFGRADIVIFHADGTASVIEAKDGSKGYKHVVGGIGQTGLYAAQLAATKGALKKVRRCLLWTSTNDLYLDSVIEAI